MLMLILKGMVTVEFVTDVWRSLDGAKGTPAMSRSKGVELIQARGSR